MAGHHPSFNPTTFRDAAEWAWLAGLFEGEGCVTCVEQQFGRLQLQIKMTDRDVLCRARGIADAGRLYGPYQRKHWKPCYTWIVYRAEDVTRIMEIIEPWLGERRREQWQRALAARQRVLESRTTEPERFWAKVEERDGCLIWTGAKTTRGCGHFSLAHTKTIQAHRYAYELSHGKLPKYANLHNTCGNLSCVQHWVPKKVG